MDRTLVRDELKSRGLRGTGPRVAVLLALRSSKRPLSHAEVVDALRTDEWDRATVYRNLIKLTEAGLAHLTSHAGGIARYEAARGDQEQHLHADFSCKGCGLVSCLDDAPLKLPQDPGWKRALEGAEVQVVGICPDCRTA